MIDVQIYVGQLKPDISRFNPIKNRRGNCTWCKPEPQTGFWTSTYDEVSGGGWVQWSLAEDFGVPSGGWNSWLVYPRKDLRVYEIDCLADLDKLLDLCYTDFGAKNPIEERKIFKTVDELVKHYDEEPLVSGKILTGLYVPTQVKVKDDKDNVVVDGFFLDKPRIEYPDFELLAKHFDVIHLTENGQYETRLNHPDLYGWDCESSLWLNWAVEKVEDLGIKQYKVTWAE